MPITIGSDIASLNARRALGTATEKLGAVSERLSSGQRINKASDDASGLAIADSLRTDARVFTQGVRNVNDAVSFLFIAEGATNELKNIITRGMELAEQAASGSFSDKQRSALDGEYQSIASEFNRILESAKFNGVSVFSCDDGPLVTQAGVDYPR